MVNGRCASLSITRAYRWLRPSWPNPGFWGRPGPLIEKLKRRAKDDFKGRHFEATLILQAVSWYLRLRGGCSRSISAADNGTSRSSRLRRSRRGGRLSIASWLARRAAAVLG